MGFKIEPNNIDEWCFRYLENDLSDAERKFFEQAIEFDENIKLEYLKWDKTKLTSINDVYVSPEIGVKIVKNRKAGSLTKWFFVGVSSVAVLSILLNLFLLNQKVLPKKQTLNNRVKIDSVKNEIIVKNDGIKINEHHIGTNIKRLEGVKSPNFSMPKSNIAKPIAEITDTIKPYLENNSAINKPLSNDSFIEKVVTLEKVVTDSLKTKKKKVKKSKSNDTKIIKIHDNL
jgi:hypothetical protein